MADLQQAATAAHLSTLERIVDLQQASAAEPPNREVFPFFELPREMRDLIYAFSTNDGRTQKLGATHCAMVPRNVALPNLLVLCRQFKLEYTSVTSKLTALHVFDLKASIPSERSITALPTPAYNISSLALHLVTDCARPELPEMQEHMLWVKHLLDKLPQLRNLAVTVYVETEHKISEISTGAVKADLSPWLALPHLQKLEVYGALYRVSRTVAAYNDPTSEELLTKWAIEAGKWEDAVKKAAVVEMIEDDHNGDDEVDDDLWDMSDDKDTDTEDEGKVEEELTAADDESDEEWLAPVNPFEYGTAECRQFNKREVLDT